MTGVLNDLRYGLRGLAKSRGFAAAAVLSLALGVGANTTIFTLLNAVFLRPLPVHQPDRLVALFTTDPRTPGHLPVSYPNYRDYRDHNSVFSSLLLYAPGTMNLTGRGDPQLLLGQLVSGNYFEALGVRPVVGRGFLPEEDAGTPTSPVAVISHGLWTRLYAETPGITENSIEINGAPYRIVGVAPDGFFGLNRMSGADVFVPFSMYPKIFPSPLMVMQRRGLLFMVAGRLKDGVTVQQAQAAMRILSEELERQYPNENRGRRALPQRLAEATMDARTRPVVSQAGTILMAISTMVLLIACGNVANLQLARAAGRQREIAIRLAMGATRGRLIRQLLTESLLLSGAGAVAGLLLARWARDLLWWIRPPMFNHAAFRLDLDGRVLLFTLWVSVATGILFGLVPALRSTRADLANHLKQRGAVDGGLRHMWRPRAVLVMAQVALSVVALIGAGLFVRSLRNANRIDTGFDAPHLAIVAYNVTDQGYNEARGRDFHERAIQRAAAMPGVEAAAVARDLPFHVAAIRTVLLDGETNGHATLTSVVGPGYLGTMRVALLRGRDFSRLDTKTSPRVAIVNQAAAANWPGGEAIGKRISFEGEGLPVEIVGIAKNANYQAVGEPPQPLVYISLVQYYFPTGVLYVRTTGDPAPVVARVKRELQLLDPNLMLQAETLGTSMKELLWAQRLSAGLLAVFGALALVLSTIGIYGVVSYSVRQRTRELGLRLALGATTADVQRLIVGEGVRLVAIGVLAGGVISLAGVGLAQDLLFLQSPRDAVTFTLVPALLMLVGIAACWYPARRATRIDPAVALREE